MRNWNNGGFLTFYNSAFLELPISLATLTWTKTSAQVYGLIYLLSLYNLAFVKELMKNCPNNKICIHLYRDSLFYSKDRNTVHIIHPTVVPIH